MIVPLSYFIEKPFQNWTRESGKLIRSVIVHADDSVPVARLREKLDEIVKGSPLWDGRVAKLQVFNANATTIELRALMSARTASDTAELRFDVREEPIEFLASEHPYALPHARAETHPGGPAWALTVPIRIFESHTGSRSGEAIGGATHL